ncbi:unnamed protein product, partial [Amoebophrya sp. A120]
SSSECRRVEDSPAHFLYQSEKSPHPISETEDSRICDAVFEYTNRRVLLEGQETKLRPKLQAICHAVSHFQLPPVILALQGFPT